MRLPHNCHKGECLPRFYVFLCLGRSFSATLGWDSRQMAWDTDAGRKPQQQNVSKVKFWHLTKIYDNHNFCPPCKPLFWFTSHLQINTLGDSTLPLCKVAPLGMPPLFNLGFSDFFVILVSLEGWRWGMSKNKLSVQNHQKKNRMRGGAATGNRQVVWATWWRSCFSGDFNSLTLWSPQWDEGNYFSLTVIDFLKSMSLCLGVFSTLSRWTLQPGSSPFPCKTT